MTQTVDDLILDFAHWLAPGARPYAEVMEVWRTSCPRLTVWEDAVDRGLVERRPGPGGRVEVALTGAGQALLENPATR